MKKFTDEIKNIIKIKYNFYNTSLLRIRMEFKKKNINLIEIQS